MGGAAGDDRERLADRVAALERTVERLERRLATVAPGPDDARQTGALEIAHEPRRADDVASTAASRNRPRPTIAFAPADPGQWVNRLGIALLLLGAAFGFKYSIDRGWIGPAVRVASGLGLGALLVAASSRLRSRRPGLSRVLAGGGIACGYLSIYAAFQLYELVPHSVAFAAMSGVTVLAFAVAVRGDDAMTATIGTIGGLATPLLLETGGGSAAGLVGYTSIVVAGAGAVFARRGWRVVLWTAAAGGWLLLFVAAEDLSTHSGLDAAVVETGIVFLALATWWLAVLREMLAAEDPARWRPTRAGLGLEPAPSSRGSTQAHRLALATPLLVLLVSGWNWQLTAQQSGWSALLLAAAWSAVATHLARLELGPSAALAATHLAGAAAMLAIAIAQLLGDDAERIALALEALAVVATAARLREPGFARLGHLLFAVVSFLTLGRLVDDIGDAATGLHGAEASDAVVIAALAAAARVAGPSVRSLYFVAAETGLILWLVRVLGPLDNGAAWVTASWFANAVVLVVAGLRADSSAVRRAGAAVMALTMGKLFVFDLATVDAGWRIVTFVGFGGVLLALGYAFPSLWKRGAEDGPIAGPPS